MASSSTSLSVASSSSTHPWKYDVFLSFRGEDTRRSFTDHLHAALRQRGIDTFIDDQLRRGEQISPALLQAIEESRFSIIIFSEDYASSSWCLVELTKIIECVKLRGHKAFPVFYNVDPSHVRKQTGSYAEAFKNHEQVYRDDMEKVLRWREALTEASGLSGWDSRDSRESEVIKEIVFKISNEPVSASSSNMGAYVGMDSRIKDMISLLCIGLDDVRMVGLWGMAGIGKTTIAEAVYQKFCTQFEGCCFLSNVREKSQQKNYPTNIQTELLSQISRDPNTKIFDIGANFIENRLHSMKVLIVLDDVDRLQQLEDLAGNHNWFGPGSRIIITTRDKHLLDEEEVKIYEVKELNKDEALMLFHQHAFKHKPPTEDFVQLCDHVLSYTKGIPLALKILGCFLYNRSKKEWESELEKLERIPNKEIQDVLRISFDGLDDNQREIFLDIACFFEGRDKDYVTKKLKSCDFFPEIETCVLKGKSLITISDNKVCMHDLMQEMGWEIVRQESIKDPGRRSRLWVNEDVIHMLTTNTGTEAVEGIVLDLSTLEELHFSVDVFTKMNRLRVLNFCDARICGNWEYFSQQKLLADTGDDWTRIHHMLFNFNPYHKWYNFNLSTKYKLHLSGDFKFLSNNLRSICWHGYPLKSLPSSFHLDKLLELDMCFSQLEQLWEGNMGFPKLEFINLRHSQHLIKTPDFSGAPQLRTIILEGCTSLVKVHPSIGALKKLISLNLEGCKNLKSFLSSIHMESLQILTLSSCSKLKKFPEVQGAMDNLSKLSLKGTAIKGLPLSIEYLNGLALLNLGECKSLESLPSCIFKLKSLKILILSNCLRLKKLPEIRENMESLKELYLDETGLRELLSSIKHLNGLEVLSLAGCKGGESKSRHLALALRSSPTQGLRLPSLSVLYSLRELNLSDCNLLEGALPSDLSSLSLLDCLDLSRNSFITVPASLSRLPRLRKLIVEHCESLQSLPELPSSIKYLLANDCTSLEPFSDSLSALRKFGRFNFQFRNCFRLVENGQSDIVEALRPKCFPRSRDPAWDGLYTAFDVVVPGSSIPEWLIHQNVGCSVTVELPPHWYNIKSIGLAVCAIFEVNISKRKFGRSAYFSVNESGGFSLDNTASMHFLKADHIWFGYRSISGGDFIPSMDHLTASITTFGGGEEIVKKCGIRLIYEEDVMGNASFLSAPCGREKEMNQIQNQDTVASTSSTHHMKPDGRMYGINLRYEKYNPALTIALHRSSLQTGW